MIGDKNIKINNSLNLYQKILSFSQKIYDKYQFIDRFLYFPDLIYMKNLLPEVYYTGKENSLNLVKEINNHTHHYIYNINYDILFSRKMLSHFKYHLLDKTGAKDFLTNKTVNNNIENWIKNETANEKIIIKLKERLVSYKFMENENSDHIKNKKEETINIKEEKVKDIIYKKKSYKEAGEKTTEFIIDRQIPGEVTSDKINMFLENNIENQSNIFIKNIIDSPGTGENPVVISNKKPGEIYIHEKETDEEPDHYQYLTERGLNPIINKENHDHIINLTNKSGVIKNIIYNSNTINVENAVNNKVKSIENKYFSDEDGIIAGENYVSNAFTKNNILLNNEEKIFNENSMTENITSPVNINQTNLVNRNETINMYRENEKESVASDPGKEIKMEYNDSINQYINLTHKNQFEEAGSNFDYNQLNNRSGIESGSDNIVNFHEYSDLTVNKTNRMINNNINNESLTKEEINYILKSINMEEIAKKALKTEAANVSIKKIINKNMKVISDKVESNIAKKIKLEKYRKGL